MTRTPILGSITVRNGILSGGVTREDGSLAFLKVPTEALSPAQKRQPMGDVLCALDADMQAGLTTPATLIVEDDGTYKPHVTLSANADPRAVAAVYHALTGAT